MLTFTAKDVDSKGQDFTFPRKLTSEKLKIFIISQTFVVGKTIYTQVKCSKTVRNKLNHLTLCTPIF